MKRWNPPPSVKEELVSLNSQKIRNSVPTEILNTASDNAFRSAGFVKGSSRDCEWRKQKQRSQLSNRRSTEWSRDLRLWQESVASLDEIIATEGRMRPHL